MHTPRKVRKVKLIILLICALLFLVSSCIFDNDNAKNNPPVISNLTANPSSVQIGGSSILTCTANDKDGDKLTYSWKASSGSISDSESRATWIAPNTQGTYTVSCTVSDGQGGQDIETININVIPDVIPANNKTGSLQVSSNPSGARIYLDEKDTEYTTPHIITNIPKGFHTVKIIHADRPEWGPKSIEIKENQTITVDATLGFWLGLELLPQDQYASLSIVAPSGDIGVLPSSLDLSNSFPTPGNQNPQGSCVGWAVSYVKTYHECVERKWSLNDNYHIMSPTFIYNQIKIGDCKTGSYIHTALNLLQTKGCCSMAMMPYSKFDCNSQPSSVAFEEAFKYRISQWSRINQGSIQEMKGFLANDKQPLIVAIKVLPDFDALDEGNPIYDDISGDSRGNHAIALIGYDDIKNAFKFINSWSTNWGINGYGWISYNIVLSVVTQGYVAFDYIDKGNPPELKNSAVSPSTGNTSTTFTYTVYYFDKDNNVPTEIKVFIDGIGHDMNLISGSASDGTYQFTTKLVGGIHQYYFFVNDGTYTYRLPSSEYFSGPQVTQDVKLNTISSPDLNSVWTIGDQNVSIKWSANYYIGKVEIHLITSHSSPEFDKIIISSTENDGLYDEWDIPSNLEPRNDYYIRIIYNDGDYSNRIRSGSFKIVKKINGYANKDTYISEESPSSNYGKLSSFVLGESGSRTDQERYILLDFDFIRQLPTTVKCESATLRLSVDKSSSEKGTPFEAGVGMITSDWEENTVTWNYRPGFLSLDCSITIPSSDVSGYNYFEIQYVIKNAIEHRDFPYKGIHITPSGDRKDKEKWYYSREHSNVSMRPYLEIKYYNNY